MLDRAAYLPFQAYTKVIGKGTDAEVYVYNDSLGRPCARGFHGRAAKPDFKLVFQNAKRREDYVTRYFEGRRATVAFKNERKAVKKAKAAAGHDFEVGTILCCEWGSTMSLVDFYRVVELIGKTTVVVEKIKSNYISGDGWTGQVIADIDSKGGERSTHRVIDGRIKISDCQRARKWDGQSKYYNTLD